MVRFSGHSHQDIKIHILAEVLAVLVTTLFLLGKRKKYHY